MNILTVSASPFLYTRLGRINSEIINLFKNDHKVATVSWDHDINYFLPADGENEFYYEDESGDPICRLYPIGSDHQNAVKQSYEAMKDFKPDVVITIGDYHEVFWMYAIKSMYPHLFKWVSVLTINSEPISEDFVASLEYIDRAIVTTRSGLKEVQKHLEDTSNFHYVPFGPDLEKFYPENNFENNNILNVVGAPKNSQSCNIGCWLQSIENLGKNFGEKFNFQLHTNINDPGDYDIYQLIDRYEVINSVELPEDFISISESVDDDYMRKIYSRSDVVLDLSVRSSTGLHVLEAMSCGCIPLCSSAPALLEIIEYLDSYDGINKEEFLIQCCDFIGERGEVMKIANYVDVVNKLGNFREMFENNLEKFKDLQSKSIEVASFLSKEKFLKRLDEELKVSVSKESTEIPVETIS